MIDAVKKYAGVSILMKLKQLKKQEHVAKEHHVEFEEQSSKRVIS